MLSLIVPAYNEAGRVGKMLDDYISYLGAHKVSFEIICINDGCKDKTVEIVKSFKDKCRLKQFVFPEKLGKGGAIIEGFKHAEGDFVAFTDADGSSPPQEICKMLDYLNSGKADGVIGCRWCKGAVVTKKQPLKRRMASRVFNIMVRLLFNLSFLDTQCGLKVFKRECIDAVNGKLGITNFAFDVDLLYKIKKAGFNVLESPTIWDDKDNSTLNMNRVVPIMFVSVIRLRILNSPLKYIFRKNLLGPIYRRIK